MRLPPGIFGWVDLSTDDVEKARTFYTSLFGWETTDIPTPMGPAYTMCRLGGELVAGMGPQPPGVSEAGVPPTWNSYIMVDDVDAVLEAVDRAGGALLMPADEVMSEGRLAMIADPSGAVVGLWQPRDHRGAELFNAPGSLTWNELQSRDLDAATTFYATVFGWRWAPMDESGYLVGYLDTKDGDDKSNCGAMTTPPMVPAEVPSMWNVYFAVTDCDQSVARATSLGGTVFLPTMAMGQGRFAGIADPTGGRFLVAAF